MCILSSLAIELVKVRHERNKLYGKMRIITPQRFARRDEPPESVLRVDFRVIQVATRTFAAIQGSKTEICLEMYADSGKPSFQYPTTSLKERGEKQRARAVHLEILICGAHNVA